MQNLLNDLTELLSRDEQLVSEGRLLKNKVIELALKIDANLIKHLLRSKNIKKHFFTDIDGILVFDKIKFQKFVSNKEFLPDSYTAFKNKIGLVGDGNYLSESKEVVLAWPYKDCVLEGGQTKEDQKRDEIFWNETLAPDEIDRLLTPKVLTNFKKYDINGELQLTGKEEIDFSRENLIIKGNNLLALHSLYKRFAGKVKLIYIDLPYNTGTDSFRYNDSFNHSTWLTFMKNRLQIAKDFLNDQGAIFVQIDHHELGYLNVLMDDIFGKENKVQIISIKTASPAGFKTVNPGPIDVTEYILFYTKKKKAFKFKKHYVPVEYDKNYKFYLEQSGDLSKWRFMPIKEKVITDAGFNSEKEAKQKYGNLWKSILKAMIEDFAFHHAHDVVSIRDPHKPTEKLKEALQKSRENETVVLFKREDGSTMYLYKGGALAFYSNKMKEIDGQKHVTELLSDFWDHLSWAGIAKEGGVKLKNGKKPEALIKQLIEIAAPERDDIVLDFFMGSGTTCSVAHKMGRQYIGIEQLEYDENDSMVRLQNVIKGEQSGISKAVNWKGGGSFIYCELKQYNEAYIDRIQKAKTTKDLLAIWNEMQEKAFISYKVEPKAMNENIADFEKLSLDEQKRFLIEILDKNQLYMNYSEIDDKEYDISDTDKKLNRKFYGES